MSTTDDTKKPVQSVGQPLTIRDLTEVMIKHYGLHEGLYDLLIEFQVGVGAVGPTPGEKYPGAIVGVTRIGLKRVETVSQTTVDAGDANPPSAKKPAKKPSKK